MCRLVFLGALVSETEKAPENVFLTGRSVRQWPHSPLSWMIQAWQVQSCPASVWKPFSESEVWRQVWPSATMMLPLAYDP